MRGKSGRFRAAVVLLTALALLLPAAAQAAAVGRFTAVEGQVDLLKQGKLPAAPAKSGDAVEAGDIIRSKSESRAQVKFIDDSVITLAPESRLAVADFVYNPQSRERRVVMRLLRGLVHAVVTRVMEVQQPEFLLQTFTAELGVRGTEWYTLLKPNGTMAFLLKGRLEARSSDTRIPGVVLLDPMHFTEITLGQGPGKQMTITPAMLETLKKMMVRGVTDKGMLELSLATPPPSPLDELERNPEWRMPPTIPPVQKAGPKYQPEK